MKLRRSTLIVAILLTSILLGATLFEYFGPKTIYGAVISPPKAMPNLTLQSDRGPVSLSQFKGKIVILYFGYTFCPDLCPLTLGRLHQALTSLGSKANDIQVIFVSVDWKRDTPEKASKYARVFDPGFLGLTGTKIQIDEVTKNFGVYYQLNLPADADGYYSVDHGSSVQVLNREQKLALLWPYDTQPDQIASDLQVVLQNK